MQAVASSVSIIRQCSTVTEELLIRRAAEKPKTISHTHFRRPSFRPGLVWFPGVRAHLSGTVLHVFQKHTLDLVSSKRNATRVSKIDPQREPKHSKQVTLADELQKCTPESK